MMSMGREETALGGAVAVIVVVREADGGWERKREKKEGEDERK